MTDPPPEGINAGDDPSGHPLEWQQLEAMVRAVGSDVQPSEDLRPRTLEAARELCGDHRAERKLGGFAIVMLLAVLLGSPVLRHLETIRLNAAPPTSSELQMQALAYEEQAEVGLHWGMAEVFSQLRGVQASQLGSNRRPFK